MVLVACCIGDTRNTLPVTVCVDPTMDVVPVVPCCVSHLRNTTRICPSLVERSVRSAGKDGWQTHPFVGHPCRLQHETEVVEPASRAAFSNELDAATQHTGALTHSPLPERGTRTPRQVPCLGALSMVSVPPIFVARSRIERRPRCPGKEPVGSKPFPLSRTSRRISLSCLASRRTTVLARACLTMLWRASCAMR